MRNLIQIIALSLLAVCATQVGAQQPAAEFSGVVTINNTRLTESGDRLEAIFDVRVSGQGIQNYAALYLTPRLVAEGGYDCVLPGITIQGGNKSKTFRRWERTISRSRRAVYQRPEILVLSSATDTTITFSSSVPYELWMDDAVLTLNQEFVDYRDQHSLIATALGGRVELESKSSYQVQSQVNMIAPHAELKLRKKQGQAFIDFQVGRSEIVPTYRRNPEELAKIDEAFSEIISNPDVTINALFIEGYASPEGRYATNEKLSFARSNALMDYIVRNFTLPIGDNQIRTTSVAEDWDGVRAAVQTSDISRKEQILSIIDNTPDPDKREAKLRQLGAPWQVLMRDVFPNLRRVEYQINFVVKDFAVEQSIKFIDSRPELLSQRELFLTAQTFEDAGRYENIMLNVIPRLYPNDTTANVNSAAIMIRRGEIATAKRHMERFAEAPEAFNNMGVIFMLEGQLDKAEELLQKAVTDGVKEAKFNLGEVQKKRVDNARMERYRSR